MAGVRGAVTIYAVAQRAGVSISTVSRVMRGSIVVSEPTRDRVLEAVEELRYVPSGAASNLATQRQPTLGLVLPHLEGEYYAGVLMGFELAAAELGYSVAISLANSRPDARATVRALAERVDGLAFLARSAASDALINELARSRALVTVARGGVPGVHSIRSQNRGTAADLTGHLLESGRRRLVFVGTPRLASDVAARHAGYLDAHATRDLVAGPVVDAELTEVDGRTAAERLLADGVPTDAVVCANDLVALALMKTLLAAGVRIPDDVAITGWDNIHATGYVTPALTTVDQHTHALGRDAAEYLHTQLNPAAAPGSADPPPATVFESQVVHRESCCSAAAQHSQLSE